MPANNLGLLQNVSCISIFIRALAALQLEVRIIRPSVSTFARALAALCN